MSEERTSQCSFSFLVVLIKMQTSVTFSRFFIRRCPDADDPVDAVTVKQPPLSGSNVNLLRENAVTQMLAQLDVFLARPAPATMPNQCYLCKRLIPQLERQHCAINMWHSAYGTGRKQTHSFALAAVPSCGYTVCFNSTLAVVEDFRIMAIKDILPGVLPKALGLVCDTTSLDFCIVCRKMRHLTKCIRCGAARYCSEACQHEHWPTHKVGCKVLKSYLGPSHGEPKAQQQ